MPHLHRGTIAIRLLLAAVATVLAFAAVPSSAAAARGGFFIQQIAITNSTPDKLVLTSSQETDVDNVTCWSDSAGNCIGGPQNEIDSGATGNVYIAASEVLFTPSLAGYVRYEVNDPSTGFNNSGVDISFRSPALQANSAACNNLGFFDCSSFSFTQHGNLSVSETVGDTDTCPGSSDDPCPYSSDALWGSQGTGAGQFSAPSGVAVDARPLVYVADTGNDRVQVLSTNGTLITLFGSAGSGNGQLQGPLELGVGTGSTSTSGGLYVADAGNMRIEQFGPLGPFVNTWGLPSPTAVAVSPTGDVYASSSAANRVFVFDSQGNTKGGFGTPGSGNGEFNGPTGIAIDSAGNVFVVDSGNQRVEMFAGDGTFTKTIGGPSTFAQPWGVTVVPIPSSEFIAVTDTGNSNVQVINVASGNALHPFGASGSNAGEFNEPRGIAADSQYSLYVADAGNNRVQKFVFSSSLTRFATRSARVTSILRHGQMTVPLALRCRALGRANTCQGIITFHDAHGLLARRAFDAREGAATHVSLALSRTARSLLRRSHRLSGTLLAHTRQPSGEVHITHRARLTVTSSRR